jgi:hypothetical protein
MGLLWGFWLLVVVVRGGVEVVMVRLADMCILVVTAV